MRAVLSAVLLLGVLISVAAKAEEEEQARLELNATEAADNRCRMTFLIENKSTRAIDSLKLDLALFNPEGVIQRRMIVEMGPVRGKRTNVRTFSSDGECSQLLHTRRVFKLDACLPAVFGLRHWQAPPSQDQILGFIGHELPVAFVDPRAGLDRENEMVFVVGMVRQVGIIRCRLDELFGCLAIVKPACEGGDIRARQCQPR